MEKNMKTIKISGAIGYDLFAKDISAFLDEAKGDDLDVYIASPGGSVFEGLEIYNMFRDYKRTNPKSQISATIKGLAASMATYLAVNPAFDLVCAEDNAVFMIHNAWGIAIGDSREMAKSAEILGGINALLGKVYAKRTGKSKDEIAEMMDEETWLFGDEIKKAGFVDEIIKTDGKCGKEKALIDSKLEFAALNEKMKDKKEDVSKIAAMLNDNKILDILSEAKKIKAQTPAEPNAGKNNNGGSSMTLSEFLKENPTAKAEFDEKLAEKYEAGKKAMQANIDKASPFLISDSYPKTIQNIAIDVINGKKTVEALETTVAAYDAFKESQNSQAAQDESSATGDVTGQQQNTSENGDGVIKDENDFQAEIARTKKEVYGMEV